MKPYYPGKRESAERRPILRKKRGNEPAQGGEGVIRKSPWKATSGMVEVLYEKERASGSAPLEEDKARRRVVPRGGERTWKAAVSSLSHGRRVGKKKEKLAAFMQQKMQPKAN